MATNNEAKNIEDPLTRIFEICDRNLAAEAEARKQKEDARLADLRAHNCQPCKGVVQSSRSAQPQHGILGK